MGKLNEIQQETTQSWGSNSFTTTIKEDTVEFDSVKDKFTFKDEVEVPSLKVNGETVSSQVQADWNQNNNEEVDFVKNRTHYTENGFVQIDSESVEISEPVQFSGDIQSFTGEVVNEAQYTIEFNGVTYQAIGTNEHGNVAIYYYDEETEVAIAVQESRPIEFGGGLIIGEPNENTEEQESKWVVESYGVTLSTNNVSLVVTDSQQTVMVNETVPMACDAYGEIAFSEAISIDSTYKVTIDGNEYNTTVVEEGKGGGEFYIVCDGVFKIGMGYISIFDIQYTNKTITLVINELQEVVHTIADKYLSDNIARVSSLPTQAFNIDETKYNIYPTFTNDSNTVNTGSSLILATPSTSNNSFGGSNNVSIVGANSSNTISGGYNIAILTAPATTVGGNNNLVISAYGGSQTVANSETASILIGGTGGVTMTGGGYQKTMLQPFYGSQILGDHSSIICGAGKVQGGYSSIYNAESSSNEIYGNSNIIIGGGQTFTAKIGDTSHQANVGNSIVANANGSGTITDGTGNTIAFCQGGNFTISTGATNTILGCNGSATISGGSSNLIIGGYGSITIPSTIANTIVLGNPAGGSAFTATESNTVYVLALNAINGVKTKKLTISSIDPTDVFMHSEIIDASSDVAFSRVIANTSSTKTDGYVEILYKASSGVTCSAYIDSTDVTLTADDGWHKLEQGCDPANGVEIHINNSSPVTDATLEVISKVYYI